MNRIHHAEAKEAARDYDHGRDIRINADDLNVSPKRLFRKAIPELLRRGYPLDCLLKELSVLPQGL